MGSQTIGALEILYSIEPLAKKIEYLFQPSLKKGGPNLLILRNNISPEKGPSKKDNSSNYHFSRDTLVFGRVLVFCSHHISHL